MIVVTKNITIIVNITISSKFTKLVVTVLQTLKIYEHMAEIVSIFESHTIQFLQYWR